MKMNEGMKTFLSFFLRFGLSALLLAFIFSKIDLTKTWDVLRNADIGFILLAFLCFIILHAIVLIRWYIYVRALDLDVPFFTVTRFFFIGLFGNLFLPSSIGGDIIKILGLCKNSSQKPRVIASVLLDRLTGFAGMAIVAILGFLIGYKMMDNYTIIISIVCMIIGATTAVLMLFNKKVYEFFCRFTTKFPKIQQSLMKMHEDISMLKSRKKHAFLALAVSCSSQLCLAITFYMIARALQQDIALMYFMVFVPMICVASSLPSIGGLGVREAGAAYLFSKIGVSTGIAVSISLINFLFMIIMGLLGGLIYVSTISSGRVQYNSSSPTMDLKKS